MVSTSALRTVTLKPNACDTSVSAAVAPPARAALRTSPATPDKASVVSGKRVAGAASVTAAVSVIDGLWSVAAQGDQREPLNGAHPEVPSIIANALAPDRLCSERPAADRPRLAALVGAVHAERAHGQPPRAYRELFRVLSALFRAAE